MPDDASRVPVGDDVANAANTADAASPAEIAPAADLPEAFESLAPGRVHVLGPYRVPGLTSRHVRIYLPRGYDPATGHPALYMFDGQNVFDDAPSFVGGWHLDGAVEKLARARRPVPVVVGIDHGHELRLRELSPFPIQGEAPELDSLLRWMTGSLIPVLAASVALVPGPRGAIVGGSSMGGLAAFYAHLQRPEAFGGALAMSPSFWVGGHRILDWTAGCSLPEVSRIYLDCGVREGRGTVLPLVETLAAQLRRRGYGDDRLLWRADPRGGHNEASWRRRLPRALRFLYRPGDFGAAGEW
jgi:predicted alpha/beta superfamily hydrolase